MRAEPHIETLAEPAALLPLLAAAIEGDPLVGLLVPDDAFSWSETGLPVAAMKYKGQRGPDRWPDPVRALQEGAGDCAALCRLYAQVWGSHVAMTPLEGDKIHAVLAEDGEIFDPSRAHGMKGDVSLSDLVLRPIVRPVSTLEVTARSVAARTRLPIDAELVARLAFASKAPVRLAAVAKRFLRLSTDTTTQAVCRAVLTFLGHERAASHELLRRPATRSAASVAYLFALATDPSVKTLFQKAGGVGEAVEVVEEDDLELFNPGCGGGCLLD